LAGGSHVLRADSINLFDNSKVLARAEVNFERQVPKTATAAASPPVASGLPPAVPSGRVEIGAHTSPPLPSGQSAPAPQRTAEAAEDAARWKAAENTPATAAASADPGVIIIRRGDTLWQIAERHYGSGARYTQIFQNNRDQIRNPNRIYPNQRFTVPR
jgi:nucleoid-associated protein YgaU